MALPSGYTQIDYIEATGTQYINTGFTPNGNSRIVMDCEPTDLSSTFCFFCARTEANASDTTSNTAFYISGEYRKDFYGESQSTTAAYTAGKRFTLDSNKSTISFGSDYTLTFTASSNASPMPLILMASAIPGDTTGALKNLANYAKMKLYSCKIYDNGTLVRDFVPCKNSSGVLGLWDNVNSVFYANAGTGTLTTGSKHKTLIGGTGYEIKSGRVLIGGTGYDIKKGRTLIDGTGYDISFGTPVGELEEGALVKINENGSPVEFYVAKHNYETRLNGSGRTLLVRKDAATKMAYDDHRSQFKYTYNQAQRSLACVWLNNTYFQRFDTKTKAAIGTTKFKYVCLLSSKATVETGESAIFLLAVTEVHGETHRYSDDEGELLPTASMLEEQISGHSRSGSLDNDYVIYPVNYSGMLNLISDELNLHPCFTIPSTAQVDSDFNIIPS